MKILLKFLAFVAVVGGLYLTVAYFTKQSAIVATAHKDNVTNTVSGTITVTPAVETRITSAEPGYIAESLLLEGAHIEKDQVVARIDPGDLLIKKKSLELRLDEIESKLQTEKPEAIRLKNKEKDLEDAQARLEQGHIARSEFDRLENDYLAAKAEVLQEEDALQNQRKLLENEIDQINFRLSRLEIKSPLTGTVTSTFAHTGDLVQHGTALAMITSDAVKIEAEVNQDDVAAVRTAQTALIRFFAYSGQFFEAEVKQLLPSTDAATQRFTVYLELLEEPVEILPGLTGEVSFVAGERANTLIIPRRALLNNQVMVIKDGAVEMRTVEHGYLSMTKAEILSGIEAGERVIVEDLDLFRDGDRVRIEATIN